jgi:hypothetical protein
MLAAVLLTFLTAEAGTVKKVFEIDDFTGISATDNFEVTLVLGDTFRIEVEVTDEFLPYVVVKNNSGVLDLRFSKLPFKLRQKERKKVAKAVVQLPKLTYISLSGASKLSSSDRFSNAMNKIELRIAGASSISNLSVQAPDVDIQVSGASKATLSVRGSDVRAEVSGASTLDVVGHAVDYRVNVSGSSRVKGEDFEVEEADVTASGASSVDVLPMRALSVDLSGASKCRYHGESEDLHLKSMKVSGTSSIKQEK